MSDIGIIVVTHNSEAEIGACLDAALGTGAEVVVVDNASRDATLAEARRRPGVKVIANPWNRGFAAAVNQGAQSLQAPLLLLLNPDAELLGSLEPLAEACRRPGVGAAGGKLLGADGQPQAGFVVRRLPTASSLVFELLGLNRLWPGNPVNRRYRCLELDLERQAEVEQPAGAFLMIRREAWRDLGGFDERFWPLWFEDVDFCRRLALAGQRVLYVPGAVARHSGGHSLRGLSRESRQLCWYDNLLMYAGKHLGPPGRRVVSVAVLCGSALRAMGGVLELRSWGPLAVFRGVIRRAANLAASRRDDE